MPETIRPTPERIHRDFAGERRRLAFALQSAMSERGLRAADLAKKIDKSPNTVGRWMKGETVMSMLDVKPVSDALGVVYKFLADPPPVPVYPIKDYLIENQPDEQLKVWE